MKNSVHALLAQSLQLKASTDLEMTEAFGGDICQSYLAQITGGPTVFVKAGDPSFQNMFAMEQKGLNALAQCTELTVPTPQHVNQNSEVAILVMNALDFGPKTDKGQRHLGRGLAQMHQITHTRFGFEADNFIGKTPQKNQWHDNWVEFWLQCRMHPQLDLLAFRGASSTFLTVADSFCAQLPSLLSGHSPKPSLLHGDLWSGNFGILNDHTPCIFDPAVYYGDRETDLAMTRLFGGFSKSFYEGYQEVLPQAPGHEERQAIYNLYHILNHANLFGGGYFMQAQTEMQRFL
ncbi:MAG: hypothetical protein CMH56_01335 [Myxococcales bacterium]|nr:hypothetical protein [Myxococcales bacterium]